VRLIPLEIGHLDADLQELLGTPGRMILPVPAWLIEHERGLLLFDTGLHPDLRASVDRLRGAFGNSVVDLPTGADLTARLAIAGARPGDVGTVVLSHLHFDHCGGTAEVPDARLVVQRDEWDAAHQPRLVEAGVYNPDDFDVGHDVVLADGVHDVFGDGRVVCIPTPGHTKGHQSLRVELDSGPVVLTADCIYFRAMLDEMRVPAFGYRLELQRESMRTLAAMEAQGSRLLFGHDQAQFASLPAGGLT
jgi:glyoxylase-like metal-dependent hydrolase (beta-lactamase superfamily II)